MGKIFCFLSRGKSVIEKQKPLHPLPQRYFIYINAPLPMSILYLFLWFIYSSRHQASWGCHVSKCKSSPFRFQNQLLSTSFTALFHSFTHLTDGRHNRSLGYPNLIWFNQAVSSSFTHCFIVLPKSYLELFELVKKTMGSNSLMFSIHLNTIAKRSLIYKQIEFNKVF